MSQSIVEIVRDVLSRHDSGALSREDCVSELMQHVPTPEALDDVAETVHGLILGIEEFRGVLGRSSEETADLLQAAQRRFAIQLSATMLDESTSEESHNTNTSFKRLRGELVDLSERVADLVQSTILDAQARQELEIAGTVQQMLVPDASVALPGLKYASWFRPAEQCSGDWWNIARLGKQDTMLMVGDVTGHGAPAAIVAGMAKGALDMARVGMRDSLRPFMALNMMNYILMENMRGEFFMSGVLARYEAESRSLRIGNAGHRAPLVIRAGGTQVVIGDRSAPLGTSRGAKYNEEVVAFEPGDIFITSTDGIPEAEAPNGAQWGERNFREVCEKAYAGGPAAICDAVQAAVLEHTGSLERLDDDVTLVVVQAT